MTSKKKTVFGAAKVAALETYYKPKKKKRMAKSKVDDPIKVRNKLLTTAIKKTVNHNTVLPILEDVYFTGKEAVVCDLETSVIIPFVTDGIPVCAPAKKMLDVMEIMDIAEMKVDKNFGITFKGAKREIKLMGENPDNFPITPMFTKKDEGRGGQPYTEVGRFTENDMAELENAICFVSNDDLRPAMTGVYIEATDVNGQSWMAATDAHRLFYKPISEMKETFILPPKAVKILIALGGEWSLTSNSMFEVNEDGKIKLKQPTKKETIEKETFEVDGIRYLGNLENRKGLWKRYESDVYETFEEYLTSGEVMVFSADNEECYEEIDVPDTDKQPEPNKIDAANICFKRGDGVMLVTRIIDARFPDYRVVIPNYEDHVARIISDKEFLLREMKNAVKFSNRSTNQVVFTLNGSVKVNSQDVDFSEEYNYEFTPGEAQAVFVDGFAELEQAEVDAWNERDQRLPEWRQWKKMQEQFPRLQKYKGIAYDELNVAFNGKFLQEIFHKQPEHEPVVIKIFGPTKAAIINDGYLVMPLMLNQ